MENKLMSIPEVEDVVGLVEDRHMQMAMLEYTLAQRALLKACFGMGEAIQNSEVEGHGVRQVAQEALEVAREIARVSNEFYNICGKNARWLDPGPGQDETPFAWSPGETYRFFLSGVDKNDPQEYVLQLLWAHASGVLVFNTLEFTDHNMDVDYKDVLAAVRVKSGHRSIYGRSFPDPDLYA